VRRSRYSEGRRCFACPSARLCGPSFTLVEGPDESSASAGRNRYTPAPQYFHTSCGSGFARIDSLGDRLPDVQQAIRKTARGRQVFWPLTSWQHLANVCCSVLPGGGLYRTCPAGPCSPEKNKSRRSRRGFQVVDTSVTPRGFQVPAQRSPEKVSGTFIRGPRCILRGCGDRAGQRFLTPFWACASGAALAVWGGCG